MLIIDPVENNMNAQGDSRLSLLNGATKIFHVTNITHVTIDSIFLQAPYR